jgi:hypothetical protein
LDYSGRMSDQEDPRFREYAAECRRLADQADNPLDKEAWLRLAEDWAMLAAAQAIDRAS